MMLVGCSFLVSSLGGEMELFQDAGC
jgi:hypothetical protein